MAHVSGRVGTPPRLRPDRPPRSVNMIVLSIFLGLFAIIGLSFLAVGSEFAGHVIRTTATVIAVHGHPDSVKDGTTVTLRFTDQNHQLVTVETGQVIETPPVVPGDRIQVYVPAQPSDVTDVRYGPPGTYDYEMGAAFLGIAVVGWSGIAVVWVRRKRRIAKMVTGLVSTG